MEKMIKELTAMTDFFESLKILAIKLESLERILEEKMKSCNQITKNERYNYKSKRR